MQAFTNSIKPQSKILLVTMAITVWMRRDSNAGKGRELDQRDEFRAALAGMPVPRGQGRFAGTYR